jgi:hypothetical protein
VEAVFIKKPLIGSVIFDTNQQFARSCCMYREQRKLYCRADGIGLGWRSTFRAAIGRKSSDGAFLSHGLFEARNGAAQPFRESRTKSSLIAAFGERGYSIALLIERDVVAWDVFQLALSRDEVIEKALVTGMRTEFFIEVQACRSAQERGGRLGKTFVTALFYEI